MTLVKALDHEATAMIEVIITLTGNVLAFLNFFIYLEFLDLLKKFYAYLYI